MRAERMEKGGERGREKREEERIERGREGGGGKDEERLSG